MPKVLVVDDDVSVLWMIRQRLAIEGYTVVEAQESQEAWRLLSEDLPDSALIDLALRTQEDGWTLISRIREDGRFAHLPVVVMTGMEVPDLEERAADLGCPVLRKPFSPNDLVHAIRDAIRDAMAAVQVALLLPGYSVEGTIYVPGRRGRFSDAWDNVMREDRTFVPVTDATITSTNGATVAKEAFLQVRKESILGVYTLDQRFDPYSRPASMMR
jgi:CheY-like chemotaxis protein